MTPTPNRKITAAVACVAGLLAVGAWGGVSQVAAQEFDINEVFWCHAGKNTGEQTEAQCTAARDAILGSCTSCHAITPIVKAQKDKKGWDAFLQTHQTRVPDIAPDTYAQIAKFLQAHYNPQNPVPKLPPELDALGVPPA